MYYIAYGSNLNFSQMQLRCRGARLSAIGYLKDYVLCFRGQFEDFYCTIEKEPGGRVPVAVFEITPRHKVSLDIYEGVMNGYYRTEVIMPCELELEEGEIENEELFVYVMNEEETEYGLPTEEYWNTVLVGYEELEMEPSYLVEALQRSKQ